MGRAPLGFSALLSTLAVSVQPVTAQARRGVAGARDSAATAVDRIRARAGRVRPHQDERAWPLAASRWRQRPGRDRGHRGEPQLGGVGEDAGFRAEPAPAGHLVVTGTPPWACEAAPVTAPESISRRGPSAATSRWLAGPRPCRSMATSRGAPVQATGSSSAAGSSSSMAPVNGTRSASPPGAASTIGCRGRRAGRPGRRASRSGNHPGPGRGAGGARRGFVRCQCPGEGRRTMLLVLLWTSLRRFRWSHRPGAVTCCVVR